MQRTVDLVPVYKAGVALAISAAHAPLVTGERQALQRLLVPLLDFFAAAYAIAATLATRLGLAHPQRVTLTMTTMAGTHRSPWPSPPRRSPTNRSSP